ncbi:MFS transporter [Sphingobium amiense]|uniref:MFS transporter n=1 Tax=Sphingobium amiense TaxID=135719 RepID=A0A494W1E3_9SPHN|nr:MFS transporter [Sphingobium amiense]BBD97018.1 MFS transporter [Sphingobium amiense]
MSREKLLVLLCVSVPSFMINLDGNIVAVSLPSIAHKLNASFAAVEWVISSYTLTFAALVMPAGALADRYGRKRILLIGLALFTLASFFCGAAPTSTALNVARAFQGIGAALLLSAALALLSKEFQGAERAPAFAFWGSVIGIAITLGPLIGGVITQKLGWVWAFFVNVPVGIVMIVLTAYTVEESRDPDSSSIDWAGFVSFASSLFLLTFALISGNRRGWSDPQIVAALIASAVLFAAFIIAEKRQRRPMLDLSFFRRPTYIGANLAGLAYAAALLTMLTYIPLYFQGGFGLSPSTAGILMVPMALPLFIVPRIVGKYLVHKFSGRGLLTTGLILVSSGMFALAALVPGHRFEPMLVAMLIAGVGAGVLNGETAKVGLSVIPPERAGMAAGVGGTVRFAGIVVGFAALGAVLYERVAFSISRSIPGLSAASVHQISGFIASGNIAAANRLQPGVQATLLAGFGEGYQVVFFAAGVIAALGAVASWTLVAYVKPSTSLSNVEVPIAEID